jgi:hypothetical protein
MDFHEAIAQQQQLEQSCPSLGLQHVGLHMFNQYMAQQFFMPPPPDASGQAIGFPVRGWAPSMEQPGLLNALGMRPGVLNAITQRQRANYPSSLLEAQPNVARSTELMAKSVLSDDAGLKTNSPLFRKQNSSKVKRESSSSTYCTFMLGAQRTHYRYCA